MTQKFNILVVDDDLKNIQVGINFLKQNENYHLVFATSGQQALERVREVEFDLVLLDIIMPVMDGYEVCRQLKADPETKNIPVIFLTAKHEADSLMKGFELGGADYITKPFNAPELNARVRTHLELHYHYKMEIVKMQEVLACSQKAETIKFITGGLTHDCNNFMTSIPPSLHLLQSRLGKNGIDVEPYRDLLDGVTTAVAKVSDLLAALTRFSLQEESDRQVVDINEVVQDIKKIYRGTLNSRIAFDSEILCPSAVTYINKIHLEQVLLNMLLNAQRAIVACENLMEKKGAIGLTIDEVIGTSDPALDSEQTYLCITVKDNGIGMTPEAMEKIFDHCSMMREGERAGLGLAVSQNIIHSYDGCIQVASELGSGTAFCIYLPSYAGSDSVAA